MTNKEMKIEELGLSSETEKRLKSNNILTVADFEKVGYHRLTTILSSSPNRDKLAKELSTKLEENGIILPYQCRKLSSFSVTRKPTEIEEKMLNIPITHLGLNKEDVRDLYEKGLKTARDVAIEYGDFYARPANYYPIFVEKAVIALYGIGYRFKLFETELHPDEEKIKAIYDKPESILSTNLPEQYKKILLEKGIFDVEQAKRANLTTPPKVDEAKGRKSNAEINGSGK